MSPTALTGAAFLVIPKLYWDNMLMKCVYCLYWGSYPFSISECRPSWTILDFLCVFFGFVRYSFAKIVCVSVFHVAHSYLLVCAGY